MAKDLLVFSGVFAATAGAVGALAWLAMSNAPPPPPVAKPAARVAPEPPPSPAPKPAVSVVAAPPPAVPAAPANPDDNRFAQEIRRIESKREGLHKSFEVFRQNGMLSSMDKMISELKALPSTACLAAEHKRGTPFYPALATCKAATAER